MRRFFGSWQGAPLWGCHGIIFAAALGWGAQASAFERLDFNVVGADKALTNSVRLASLLVAQTAENSTDSEDLFTAARADYARILGALYAEGYYAPVIQITVDGREAAGIAPLDAPGNISVIAVSVTPGPQFQFGDLRLGPLAPGTELTEDFRKDQPARAGVIESAVSEATLAWREESHAKVSVARDDVIADHATRRISTAILLDPGPPLKFGPLTVKGAERMEVRRILKIAGLNTGEKFSQTELDRATNRLRRSGVFSTVTLTEGEQILQGGLLPIEVTVVEQKTRRYSLGAEASSVDGLSLSGYWLHRNLRGGAERLRVDANISNIGASGGGGTNYGLGVTIDRPATLTPDTTASLLFKIDHQAEVDYDADSLEFGLNFTQYFTEQLTVRGGISYEYVRGTDPNGDFIYRNLALPLGATWDRRDNTTDAKKGFYIDGGLKPFYGLSTTGSGAKITADLRGYRSFSDDRFTFALRLQGGAILGASLLETPRDDLFFSGGGGTVRGQPYRSLGVEQAASSRDSGMFTIGGTEFAAASVELRGRFGSSWGGVVFFDAGMVGDGGASRTHSGAGLGLRYETGFGPVRFDVAAPVSGDTDDGVQIYIGLGQAF